jgi:hypothetical protein
MCSHVIRLAGGSIFVSPTGGRDLTIEANVTLAEMA